MSATYEYTTFTPSCALALQARHIALLEADAPGVEIDAVLEQFVAELKRLAATPARSPEHLRDKADVLNTCVVRSRSRPAEIVGDYGLAVSLLDDLLAR